MLGIVVIGRNEGERLARCLDSVRDLGCALVYVDSGSTDNSLVVARARGIDAIELDRLSPFTAARARNAGFKHLYRAHRELEFVQFLDGDCTLVPGWIEAAAKVLMSDVDCSAVVGELLERNADASIYNRLCALEWRTPPQGTKDFGRVLGGISMIRSKVFHELNGFREDMIAAEDTEFGIRMTLAGYKIVKLQSPMAIHDAEMTRFWQWWRRAIRAGHAIGQRYDIQGKSPARDCVRERRSTAFWGIGLPALILATLLPTRGASLVLLLGYPVLAARMWKYRRRLGDAPRDALLYAGFGVIGKFANALGLGIFLVNKLKRRYELIEYK